MFLIYWHDVCYITSVSAVGLSIFQLVSKLKQLCFEGGTFFLSLPFLFFSSLQISFQASSRDDLPLCLRRPASYLLSRLQEISLGLSQQGVSLLDSLREREGDRL